MNVALTMKTQITTTSFHTSQRPSQMPPKTITHPPKRLIIS